MVNGPLTQSGPTGFAAGLSPHPSAFRAAQARGLVGAAASSLLGTYRHEDA
jgi:hypothetical protein